MWIDRAVKLPHLQLQNPSSTDIVFFVPPSTTRTIRLTHTACTPPKNVPYQLMHGQWILAKTVTEVNADIVDYILLGNHFSLHPLL